MERQILERFPGISCAYRSAEGIDRTEYYGFSDIENSIPVQEHTIFPACSISKFITAIGLLKLQEQGRIRIDAPVNQYLTQWKLPGADKCESNATIKELMSHTAGVVDGEDSFYGLRRSDAIVSIQDILDGSTSYNHRPVRTEMTPGTEFAYSDAGYCVLQRLVEEVTGQEFAEAMQALVLAPLGLDKSFFASSKEIGLHENRMACGYDGDNCLIPGKFPQVPDLAASGFWCTPVELLTIAREFVAAYHGNSLFLQKTSAQEIAKPVERFPWVCHGLFTCGENGRMSQGWSENGQCMMKLDLQSGEIAIVMTNRNPEMDQAESGVEWLVNRYWNENT